MSDVTEPVDTTHRDCVRLRQWVNDLFLEAKIQAAKWEPRPCPPPKQ